MIYILYIYYYAAALKYSKSVYQTIYCIKMQTFVFLSSVFVAHA